VRIRIESNVANIFAMAVVECVLGGVLCGSIRADTHPIKVRARRVSDGNADQANRGF